MATTGSASIENRSNLKGIGWILLTGVFFVAVTAIVRHLGTDMSPVQAAFIRYAIGFAFFMPMFVRTGEARFRRPRRLSLHVLRGMVHGTGVMLWFYAMARIPIAEVTALGFTAPIFTTIGAVFFLGERLQLRRILAVIAGFIGVMIILRPGIVEIGSGQIAQLLAAPMFAVSFIIAKKMTDDESSGVIVASLSMFVTLTLLPPALFAWRTPSWEELFWLFLTAACATIGHMALTQAFRWAEMTVIQPFIFLQLVWAALLGLYLFNEIPDVYTWIGGAVIVASVTYIAHREARLRRTPTSTVTPG
jgi:drug/metabolite transporter (DMT)-like permease